MVQEVTTPDWVKDAVFYQIFPDRFASSPSVPKPSNLEPWDAPPTLHGFKGGDLVGVAEHLDYLQDLGITAIYFTPVFQSTANHRYHTYDYYQVDPILGGNAALRTLLDAAHAQGIRVVLDGVFNHASRGFFQFNHILENGAASPYIDWFTVYNYPMRAYERRHQYKGWVGLAALPEFNTDTPAVREFLWGVGRHWIDFGIDGWRLDVPFEIDDLLKLYHSEVTAVQLNLLDSHDMPRFLSLAKGDSQALKLATLFQMTYPGAPSIYYGDEIGFGVAVPPNERPRYDTATDPDTRRAFPWNEQAWDHELRAYFKRCIALRKAHPALRRGSFTPLVAAGSSYVFQRKLDSETFVVALNVGENPVRIKFPAGQDLPDGSVLADVWSGATVQVARGHITGGLVPARDGIVWHVQRPQTPAGTAEV